MAASLRTPQWNNVRAADDDDRRGDKFRGERRTTDVMTGATAVSVANVGTTGVMTDAAGGFRGERRDDRRDDRRDSGFRGERRDDRRDDRRSGGFRSERRDDRRGDGFRDDRGGGFDQPPQDTKA